MSSTRPGAISFRKRPNLPLVPITTSRCRSSMPVSVKDESGEDRMWRARRFAKWVTYDAQSLPIDDHTENAYEKADKLTSSRHWIPTSVARLAYDTVAPVLVVGTVTDSGRCAYCSGTRRAPECSCADYVEQKSARRSGVRSPLAGEDTERSGRHSHTGHSYLGLAGR